MSMTAKNAAQAAAENHVAARNNLERALERSKAEKDAGASCVPVYGDILIEGHKVGHIVSDGYSDLRWLFVPHYPGRREKRIEFENVDDRHACLEAIVPAWCGSEYQFGPFRTGEEIRAASYEPDVDDTPAPAGVHYRGIPESGEWSQVGNVLRVDGDKKTRLDPRLDIANHSPTGFAWGYHGSGPAQLALAILVDTLDDNFTAYRLHQAYKDDVIAKLEPGPWTIAQADVRIWFDNRWNDSNGGAA